ncbi:MAG: hypothetical protein WC570_02695 [Patescibacteria group bacterium]
MFFQRIIVFLLFEGAAYLLIMQADPIIKWIGRISFAEKFFGPTGTYTFLRLLGAVCVIAGLLYLTGLWDKALDGLFGWLAPPA